MARLLIMGSLFLLSLLNIFRAPLNILWYISILTTEFCWIFFFVVCFLLIFHFGNGKYHLLANFIGSVSLILFSLPVIQAYGVSTKLNKQLETTFSNRVPVKKPFSLARIILGINAEPINPQSIAYSEKDSLTLDYYPSQLNGNHPCVMVVHGGSWAGGNKEQLPELNSYLAKQGYNVASINYRLAPEYIYPAPVEDVAKAISYLKANSAKLHIDVNNFVLLGRSAGGQIALDAAYSLNEPSIKGVISYYGPTDMVWGYANPANPLVLDSKKIMEDYLGGTYTQVRDNYIKSSATETAKENSVPTLLIQGKNDPLVAYEHCNRLDSILNRLNVKHFILRLPWATHGCDYTLNGPAGQLSTYTTMRFLKNVFSDNIELSCRTFEK
jgi:acetyl esterase/lipase